MKKQILLALCLWAAQGNAQVYQEKLMAYNVLDYPITPTAVRDPYFRTVVASVNPDMMAVEEMQSAAGMTQFLNNINTPLAQYAMVPFIDGPDSDDGFFYKTAKFSFVNQSVIATTLRNINAYNMKHTATNILFTVYVVHLKAGSTASNETQRASEVTLLRAQTNSFAAGKNFIVCGDFNFYGTNEAAYSSLLQNNAADEGEFYDPLSGLISTGTWNSAANTCYHTQSPRVRAFGNGSTGGMDDRFDMILYSKAIKDAGGMTYIPNSTVAYGNDCNHYNDSINQLPNTAVSTAIANALHYAADHIPVLASFEFVNPVLPVALAELGGKATQAGVQLHWQSLSEVNVQNYEVERSYDYETWQKITSIAAKNTKTVSNYGFTDQNNQKTAYYRLKITDFDGKFDYSATIEIKIIATEMVLQPSQPNPFGSQTAIAYTLPQAAETSLTITNQMGETVANLVQGAQEVGTHKIIFEPKNLPNGVYYIRLQSGNNLKTSKIVYVKP